MVKPQGVRANSWQDVADLSATFGVRLDGWQELILEAAMGERSDATWAAKRVGVTVPRQNGKSQLMVARILAGALLFGEKKIVVSAHQQDTAREAFSKLVEIIEDDRNGALRARLDLNFGRGGIMNALNREAVGFKNGARVQFKARSGAAGKGFSSDCLLLDEAQILGSRAWTSINSTMSAMRNPQVWLLGTPPQEEDDCYTFDMVRRAALSGKSSASAWCEWAADPADPEYDPASELTRWSANPAWNSRINHEVVQGEFETYSMERFAQDRLGIWPDEHGADRPVTSARWGELEAASAPEGVRSYAVAFSFDDSRVSVAGSVRPPDGPVHVELIESVSRRRDAGVAELVTWFCDDPQRPERWRQAAQIALCGRAGATVLHQALRDRGVPAKVLHLLTTSEYTTSCATFLDAVRDGSVSHLAGQAPLDRSVTTAEKKPRGTDGAWGWKAPADGDETPVEAATVALWAAKTTKRRPGRTTRGVVLA